MDSLFGNRLSATRKQKKISQAELAKAIGVHAGTVSHWENGKQLPETSTMNKIADCLGVSLGGLLDGTDYNSQCSEENSEVNLEELVTQLKAVSKESLQIIAPAIRAAYEIDLKR